MPNTIRLRRGSGVPVAANFQIAEPAWDETNGRLYIKNAAGTMVQIGGGAGGGTPAGSTGQIQFNSAGQFSASVDLTFNPTTKTLGLGDSTLQDGGNGFRVSNAGNYIEVGNTTGAGVYLTGPLNFATANRQIQYSVAGGGRVATLPDNTGGLIGTGDVGTVTNTMLAGGIADSKLDTISTAGKVSGAAITSGDINTSGSFSTTSTVGGWIRPLAGTTANAPIEIPAGTLVSAPAGGDVEYDGTFLYATASGTTGRGQVDVLQTFRLTANGANIGPTIADYYGANSAITLAASSVYEIEFFAYLQKNTAGTITWTIAASSAPTLISGIYEASPVAGIAAGAPITGYTGSRGSATAAFAATASVSNNAFMAFDFRVRVITNAATNLRLRITNSAGTVTPLANSFYTVRHVCGTVGSYAA